MFNLDIKSPEFVLSKFFTSKFIKLSSMSLFKSKFTFPFNFSTALDHKFVTISIIILSINKNSAIFIIFILSKFSKNPNIFPSYIGDSKDIPAYVKLNTITPIERNLYFL